MRGIDQVWAALDISNAQYTGVQELLADLETFYNDGPSYTSKIVFNERM